MNDLNELIQDCAAASAAYCLNVVISTLTDLPASERFERLKACFEGGIAAYRDLTRGLFTTPSEN